MLNLSLPGSQARESDLTTFTIMVDGQALPDTISIVAIDISKEINRISNASVILYDGDAAKQDFETSSSEVLVPGKTIEIKGGYKLDENPLFKGVIIGQRIKSKLRGESKLYIEARDVAYRMTLDRKSNCYTDISDSELFEEIINQYGDLTPHVADTVGPYPEIVQYQVSDWDLIVTRAEKVGMYCLPDDGNLHIEKPNLQKEPVLSLGYGSHIFDLDLSMDSRSQYQKITSSSWNPANQEVIVADIEDIVSPDQGNIDGAELATVGLVADFALPHSGALQQQEIDSWSEAGMIKSRFSKIRGTIQFQGDERIKPGDVIELNGLGDRFNGMAFVSGVRHVLGAGDWKTTIQIGMDSRWHHEKFTVNAVSGAGFHPAIGGLHVGVVMQLQDDPAGEDRILVRLPLVGSPDTGIWSRVATLDAGQERGTVFRPEIDDEVIVGFINEDPNQPIILGGLHSSQNPAPISASDENHHKGLVTRSGMKVVFDDEAASISVETPKGNRLEINDQDGLMRVVDEPGNSITLDSEGISLESPGSIVIKATGQASIEAANINIKASPDSLTLEGTLSTALRSDGATEVKGSVVQIN
jgi:Rhs element Vgr protein